MRLVPTRITVGEALLIIALLSSLLCTSGYGQIDKLDEAWRWTDFTTASGLPSNQVYDAQETSDGTLWAATAEGVAWFDGFTWDRPGAGIPPGPIRRIYKSGAGSDVIVLSEGIAYRGNKESFTQAMTQVSRYVCPYGSDTLLALLDRRLYYSVNNHLAPIDPPPGKPDYHADELWDTRSGAVWMESGPDLYRFKHGTWELRFHAQSSLSIGSLIEDSSSSGAFSVVLPNEKRGFWEWQHGGTMVHNAGESGDDIKSMDIDARGDILAVHHSGDIRIRSGGIWRSLGAVPPELDNAMFVRFGRNGDLWVGKEDGLHIFQGSLTRWTNLKFADPDPRNRVHDMLISRSGDLWLATGGGVIVRKTDGSVTSIRQVDGVKIDGTTGIQEDNAGNIWISSGFAYTGVFKFNGSSWQHLTLGARKEGINVHRICKDARGRLWFMGLSRSVDIADTNQPGAYLYDNGEFIHWGTDKGLPGNRVYAMVEGKDSSLWFGTYRGLGRFRNGTWKYWTDSTGLKYSRIFALEIDAGGLLWFGDEMNGAGWIGPDDVVHYLNHRDGLVDNDVIEIRLAPDSALWMTTNSGLARYKNGVFGAFDLKTGISNANLWPIIPLADRVYVGTLGSGVAILNLDELRDPLPRVLLGKPTVSENGVRLQWRAYAYLGKTPPLDLLTRYRVDGQGWAVWSTDREATFASLSPGAHEFQVEAKGPFGVFDPNGGVQEFQVPRPFIGRPVFLIPVSALSFVVLALGFVLIARRRRDSKLLRESEAKFRAVAETTPSAIFIYQDSFFCYINKATETLSGYTANELLGMRFWDIVHPDHATIVRSRGLARQQNGSTPARYEFKIQTKEGLERWVDFSAVPIIYRGNQAALGTAIDVTERKNAEAALIDSEEKYRRLFEESEDTVFVSSPDGTFVDINPAGVKLFGYASREELLRTNIARDLYAHESERLRNIQEINERGYVRDYEIAIRRKDGSLRTVRETSRSVKNEFGKIVAYRGILHDITEQKRLEHELLQAQKLESIGTLAGGIAHDFNNILTIIMSYASTLERRDLLPEVAARHVNAIQTAAQRGAGVVRQLLMFARKTDLRVENTDLNKVADDLRVLLSATFPKTITFYTELDPSVPVILADSNQLHQAILNLCVNARDAMPDGGTITMKTFQVEKNSLPDEGKKSHRGLYAAIAIADTGTGMDAATKQRLFEPFFTTKEVGKGTGLGLALVYGVVQSHKGLIDVDSTPGRGTTFTLYFPVTAI